MDSLVVCLFPYCDSLSKTVLYTFYPKNPSINMDFFLGYNGAGWHVWPTCENEVYIGVIGTTLNTNNGYNFFRFNISSITQPTVGAVSAPPLSKSITISAYPNPFSKQLVIDYELANPGLVIVNIYNSMGELIRVLSQQYQQKGGSKLFWDGKNNNGSLMPSGQYFYQIIQGNIIESKKIIFVK